MHACAGGPCRAVHAGKGGLVTRPGGETHVRDDDDVDETC